MHTLEPGLHITVNWDQLALMIQNNTEVPQTVDIAALDQLPHPKWWLEVKPGYVQIISMVPLILTPSSSSST